MVILLKQIFVNRSTEAIVPLEEIGIIFDAEGQLVLKGT
jgi:hypothetical protein